VVHHLQGPHHAGGLRDPRRDGPRALLQLGAGPALPRRGRRPVCAAASEWPLRLAEFGVWRLGGAAAGRGMRTRQCAIHTWAKGQARGRGDERSIRAARAERRTGPGWRSCTRRRRAAEHRLLSCLQAPPRTRSGPLTGSSACTRVAKGSRRETCRRTQRRRPSVQWRRRLCSLRAAGAGHVHGRSGQPAQPATHYPPSPSGQQHNRQQRCSRGWGSELRLEHYNRRAQHYTKRHQAATKETKAQERDGERWGRARREGKKG
jgi:hypothetical protein